MDYRPDKPGENGSKTNRISNVTRIGAADALTKIAGRPALPSISADLIEYYTAICDRENLAGNMRCPYIVRCIAVNVFYGHDTVQCCRTKFSMAEPLF